MSDSVPFFKKGKSRPTTNRRKRSPSPTSARPQESTSVKSQVVLPSRKVNSNLISAGTKRTTSQRDDANMDDPDAEPEREGYDVKWTAAGSHQLAAREVLDGEEAEEMLARKNKKNKVDDEEDVKDDGTYKGQKGYKTYLKKSEDIPKAMRIGPQRSTNTIRTVTITDYQPDVCKDYKETGYCGFGDTCKFLHDRGTYLAGWQLDQLAEKSQNAPAEEESDSDSEEDLPFACQICRKPFTDPVVTRCGHYYDSACAIKRYAKNPRCLVCGTATGGIFNRADKILERMKKIREQGGDKEEEEGGDAGNEVPGLNNGGSDDGEESS